MSTDFFDDDLLRSQRSGEEDPEESNALPAEPLSDVNLSRMVRQKEELNAQMAEAVKEIESLRRRQEGLERERTGLEELAQQQDLYESGKKDIREKLARGVVALEKEERLATQLVELFSTVRTRFHEALNEVEAIDEEAWPEDNFQGELNKALAIVEEARTMYGKAQAKIDAAKWPDAADDRGRGLPLGEVGREIGREKGFAYWLKVGVAVTLPLSIVLAVLFALFLFLTGSI
jgi:hypothetical protein